MDLLVFRFGMRDFGIPVTQVMTAFAIAEIDPLPDAPHAVRGVVNIHGAVTPVVDLQRRFSKADTPLHLDQRLLLVSVGTRRYALLADDVDGVVHVADDSISAMEALVPGAGIVSTVAATETGVIYIYDIDALLSVSEEAMLDAALRAG